MGLYRPRNSPTESRLLIWLTKAFGLFPLRSCTSNFGGFIYPATLIILYCLCFMAITGFASDYYNGLEQISEIGAMRRNGYYFNIFYLPLMIIPSIYHGKKIRAIYVEMEHIDKGFEYLNIRFNYDLKIKRHTLHILTFILTTLIFNMLDYYVLWEDGNGAKFILMWIIGGTPEFVNSLIICQFGILSENVAWLLAETNKIIDILTEGRSVKNPGSDVDEVSRVKMIIVQYVKLCKAIALMNDAFGFQLTVSFVIFFIRIFLHLYFVCAFQDSSIDFADVLVCGLWVLFDIGKIVYLYTRRCYNARNGVSSKYLPQCYENPCYSLSCLFSYRMYSST